MDEMEIMWYNVSDAILFADSIAVCLEWHMIIEKIPTAYPTANSWLCWDEATRLAVLIDPPEDISDVDRALTAHALTLQMLLLTHGHFDHICGADVFRHKYNVPLAIHEADGDMLIDSMKNASLLFFRESHIYRPAEKLLRDGDEISVGASTIRVLHTPGHTPGSVCYFMGHDCVTGDTLFRESIGRTDLPGGSMVAMNRSLERLAAEADDIQIYPGHGEISTMSYEKKYNPYLKRRL